MADRSRSSTPQASSVLADLKALQDRVVDRIHELEPYAQELGELREQAGKLGIDLSAAPAKRRPSSSTTKGSRRKAGGSAAAQSRRRRPRSGQSRGEQVLALVQQQPGVTIPELGTALGIDSTGLYRVVRNLESDGLVRKEGRQVQPVAQPAAAAAE